MRCAEGCISEDSRETQEIWEPGDSDDEAGKRINVQSAEVGQEEMGKLVIGKAETGKLSIGKARRIVEGNREETKAGSREEPDAVKDRMPLTERDGAEGLSKMEGEKSRMGKLGNKKADNGKGEAAQPEAAGPEQVEIGTIETQVADKRSQSLMNLIRRVHGMVENSDIEKHRQSQDYIGAILSNTKSIHYREVDVDGMYGEWVSVNRAHMKKYLILHCHGGGYSTGSSLYARTLTSKLAESTSMDVFCFDYRLAPENPYPAAVEDAMKAWNYLMLLGYGARDIVLTGDSAGGNLALALTLKLKEEGRLLPRGIVLMSPWTDLTSSGKSFQTKAELDPVLNSAYIDRMVKAYAEGQDLKQELISPLYGNFEGFPPAYIQVGENEILLSDSLRLHQAFIDANVSVKIDVWPGMWHVFQMSPMKTAWNAMDKNAEFIYDICR